MKEELKQEETKATVSLPKITQKYLDGVFEELGKMQIVLDKDPLRFGPSKLNKKIAVTRNMLTRCEQMFNHVSHFLQKYKTEHRITKLKFEIQEKHMLAKDPEVRAGKNLKDREAVAHLKLRAELESITEMESTIFNLDLLLTMIKAKRSDLRDIQSRIKDQMKLCAEDISIGRRWGNELDDAVRPKLSPKPVITPDMAEDIVLKREHHVSDDDCDDELEDLEALLRSVDK